MILKPTTVVLVIHRINGFSNILLNCRKSISPIYTASLPSCEFLAGLPSFSLKNTSSRCSCELSLVKHQ
jgi:hypothetical protein